MFKFNLNLINTKVHTRTQLQAYSALSSDHYLKVAFVTSMASKLTEKSLKPYFEGNVRMFFSTHH